MTSQILVRLDKELKDKFQWLSGIERKSVNEKVRELMEKYVKEHSLEATMKNLWDEIGSSMKKKGYKEADVARSLSDLNCCYWQAIQVLRDSVCLFSKFVRSSSVLNAVYCLTVFISLVLLMRIPAYLLNACSLLMFHAMHTKSHSPFTAAHPRN